MTASRISIVTTEQPLVTIERVGGRVIGNAFEHVPPTPWLVPRGSESHRAAALRNYFTLQIGEILAGGSGYVDMVEGGVAVAVWQHVDPDSPLSPRPGYDERLDQACGSFADRFRALEAAFASHHPGQVHDHLMFLAVHPDKQGRGLGGALLRYRLHLLDEQGYPAFLETTTAANIALYQRFWFRLLDGSPDDHGLAPYTAPDGTTTVSPMWRNVITA